MDWANEDVFEGVINNWCGILFGCFARWAIRPSRYDPEELFMCVYKPTYTDKRSGALKTAGVYWTEFISNGRRIRESTGETSKSLAREYEMRRRAELSPEGEVRAVQHHFKNPDSARRIAKALGELIDYASGEKRTLRQTILSPDEERKLVSIVLLLWS